jgi:hypothetical protein
VCYLYFTYLPPYPDLPIVYLQYRSVRTCLTVSLRSRSIRRHMCDYLFFSQSIRRHICLTVSLLQSVYSPTYLSDCISTSVGLFADICVTVSLFSVSLFADISVLLYLYFSRSIRRHICLTVSLPQSVYSPTYLSDCISTSVSLFADISV